MLNAIRFQEAVKFPNNYFSVLHHNQLQAPTKNAWMNLLTTESKGLKYIKWTTHWAQKSGLTLTFEQVTWKSIGIINLLGSTPAPSLVLIKWRVKIYWANNRLGSKEWFDLDLWTCDLKIHRDHLLIGLNPCTNVGSDQVKGSKDIERTTQWFDLDLWTCNLKINRDHLFIEGNPCTKFGIDQVEGSNDIDRTTHCA